MLVRTLTKAVPAVVASVALAVSTLSSLPVEAAEQRKAPPLRMFTTDPRPVMTIHNAGQDRWVEFNPVLYLGSRRTKLEIKLRRETHRDPIVAVVRVDGRTVRLPGKVLDGWRGFKNAFTLTWRKPSGEVITTSRSNWCPNDGQPSRLGPHAATETEFVFGCSSHPFTRSHRWGVDRGWARQVFPYGFEAPKKDLGSSAVLEVTLRWALAKAFGLSDAERTVRFKVSVKHVTDEFPGPGPGPVDRVGHHPDDEDDHTPPHSTTGGLPRAVLPDLISLPAYGISTHSEKGRDLLDFAATVYNAGPGPLVSEGFRRGSKPVMDAYQFFYRDEKQVAARKVGAMEYDTRPSHAHWHFRDFAVYDLVNKRKKRLRTSGKEAFCLAPTDAIDLLRPGAVVSPGNGDLATACGDKTSVWVREVLAAGWGDTYTQQRAGQSIDITGLRNGTYWVRVTANPVNRLFETTRKNNVSFRRVVIGGTPGKRTVRVPKFGLIDSEAAVG